MISLADAEAMLHVLSTSLPTDLHSILTDTISHAAQAGLMDLTHIVVVEPGDLVDDLIDEIGSSPLIDTQWTRWNEPGFVPPWSHLRERGRYIELLDCIADTGFAYVIYLDRAGDSELVEMAERCLDLGIIP
jgi:hypothetical protein